MTRAGKRLESGHQQEIPIRRIPWDIQEPGHFELDLVHHCGPRTEGEYVYTLQIVDVATGWSGRRAILGRSYMVVADALYYLAHQIRFPIRELHPDNGGEFLNAHLLRFLDQYYPQCDRSRCHPATPNDNRYVEQRNYTLVRAFLGDVRLDTVRQTRYLNHIYDHMHTYHNFIQPVVRLCAAKTLPDAQCTALLEQRRTIDPLALRRQIHADLQHLFTYPGALPGQPENAFETLAHPELFPAALAALDAGESVGNSLSELPTLSPASTTDLPTPRKEEGHGVR